MKTRNFGIRGQMIGILSIFSIIIVLCLGIITFQLSKSALKEQAFMQLKSVRETKKKAIQDYFSQIKNQVITLSTDMTITNSALEFTREFEALDSLYDDQKFEEIQKEVSTYYNQTFIPHLNENLSMKASSDDFIPKERKSIIVQYNYIQNNPNKLGEKNKLFSATDGSKYSEWHEKAHPIINKYLEKFGYYDIFIVNLKGDIVYSVFKEVDYGTNLFNGPYSNSNLAKAFSEAVKFDQPDLVSLQDFEFYLPSYNAPASFIASPIFKDGKKLGVLVFQMPVDNINAIMTGDKNWEQDGLGKSGETYLIGPDLKMRSNSRFLYENFEEYMEAIKSTQSKKEELELLKHLKTSILLAPVETEAAKSAISGNSGEEIVSDYRGVSVLSAYGHLNIEGLNWGILSEIDEKEAFSPIYNIRNLILIFGIVLALLSAFVANIFARGFTKPIIKLQTTFEKLALGILPPPIDVQRNDEIGETNKALNTMVESLKEASNFALEIGDGKFDSDFQPKSDEDTLGNALTQMRNRLSEVASEERKRSWGIEGLASFSDVLRKNNDNLELLSNNLISKLIDYLGANQGAIYVVNDEGEYENNPVLKLTGCYAYDRKKFIDMEIIKGEGLTGQCWIEGEKILLTDVPKNFMNIRSGLGDASPNVVLLVPLKVNDEILGVIELASFKVFEDHEVEFVEKVAESIASTLKSVKVNLKTVNLLMESTNQAEVMQQQEEEMRQNLEEMQSTQEMFDIKEVEYKDEIKSLKAIIKELKASSNKD